jgi:uncharacterized protein YegJ (DUF2314 family)
MRLNRFGWMVLPLLLLPVLGAAQDAPRPTQARGDVYDVPQDDAAMASAIARARVTLPVFHRYLEQVADGEADAKLKAQFEQGGVVEHMWIGDVRFDGRVYRGVLESRPMDLTHVAQGDAVAILPEHVTDWMVVVEDDVMLGNFTTMELRRRMSAGERAQLDRAMGFRILADSAIIAVPRT